jgi:hypothetical protein
METPGPLSTGYNFSAPARLTFCKIPTFCEDKMATIEKLQEIADSFDPTSNVSTGKWFGKPSINIGKKVFVILWGHDLVFKLTGDAHSEALKLAGAHLFDPRGNGSPMKEWVQIPEAQSTAWDRFARLAFDFVSTAA